MGGVWKSILKIGVMKKTNSNKRRFAIWIVFFDCIRKKKVYNEVRKVRNTMTRRFLWN